MDYLGSIVTVGITLLEHIEPNEYVLIHAREAIQVIDQEMALESISLWKEMLEKDGYSGFSRWDNV
ncbi:HypC/HybG/HupF family hydrogenase formation chaperone [Laceyella putida]|uniref:HypC/HybG/HupF family hydrogenase formation chaperone n=1 Tax=Laceyella putida TaxID=110101 RepID=A0ABW2RPR9_9BACL